MRFRRRFRRWYVVLFRKDFTIVSHGRSFITYRGARRYAERMNASHTAASTRWLVVFL